MNLANDPRVITYGNEERARRYVESLIAHGPQYGPVYLTVPPVLRNRKRVWAMLLSNLRELFPDSIEFRMWPQIQREAAQAPGSRVDFIVSQHAGNILIGPRHYHMLMVGPVALAESSAFAAAGKPAFVFTGNRLAAWPDCQVLKIPPESQRDHFVTSYVVLPMRPPGKPLPTFTAAMRALGVSDPGVISRAAGILPQRGRAVRVKPPAGYHVTDVRTRSEIL